MPNPASVSRWKATLLATVALLIRLTFYRLARTRYRGKLLAIVDGTGIRLGRASSHYLKRVKKRREYLLLTVLYAPEVDAFFDLVATPNTFSEIEAFRNYLLEALINVRIFWGVLADKRYDATDVIEALERRGLVPIIPARTGKLMPRGGSRLRAWMNYEAFRE
ncbi:MAG: transposase, partial [Candidatus Njordarchaeales archaeon]